MLRKMIKKYVVRKTLEMELPAWRRRGRPKVRFMNPAKENMVVMGVMREMQRIGRVSKE